MTIESNADIERQIEDIDDPWQALLKGSDVFLQHALDPVFRRIVLIEGLVAIPYLERMSITGDHYAKTIGATIYRAISAGNPAEKYSDARDQSVYLQRAG